MKPLHLALLAAVAYVGYQKYTTGAWPWEPCSEHMTVLDARGRQWIIVQVSDQQWSGMDQEHGGKSVSGPTCGAVKALVQSYSADF